MVYYHSALRNIPSLRKLSHDPELQINPQTARDLAIDDGEWIYVETVRGRVEHRARYFDGIAANVVHAFHGYCMGRTIPSLKEKDGWNRYNHQPAH